MKDNFMDKEAIAAAAAKVTVGSGGATVYFGYTANDIGVFAGVAIGLAGLAIQTYFKVIDSKAKRAHYKKLEQKE